MVSLPDWPPRTVAILVTQSHSPPRPHAIPVSAALRAGPDRALVALSQRRASLALLRAEPHVTLSVTCADRAFSADGRARVIAEELVDGVAAVAIEVDEVHDHLRPTFALGSGVGWRWTDDGAAAADARVQAALRALAQTPGGNV